jgi:hypothetical protein
MMFFYSVLINIYLFVKKFWTPVNYSIKRIDMAYTAPPKPSVGYSEFWRSEERYWDFEESRNWTVVTNRIHDMKETPSGVKDRLFTVKYYHGGKGYRMVTKNSDFTWPPTEPPATFRRPIIAAILVNSGEPIVNVTKKLAKVMGPRKDFHGQDVPIESLFDYNGYTDICVTDILNVTRYIPKNTSCLQIL